MALGCKVGWAWCLVAQSSLRKVFKRVVRHVVQEWRLCQLVLVRPEAITGYRFSAFWLRSSVVSVLISLIPDTSSIRGLYIKRIFRARSWKRGLLRPLHASTWYCSTSRNGAPFQRGQMKEEGRKEGNK